MMKFIERQFENFLAMAFSETPRKQWPMWMKLYWYVLLVFVWLYQGIVCRNWQNIFKKKE